MFNIHMYSYECLVYSIFSVIINIIYFIQILKMLNKRVKNTVQTVDSESKRPDDEDIRMTTFKEKVIITIQFIKLKEQC